jgi:hypothetical protein
LMLFEWKSWKKHFDYPWFFMVFKRILPKSHPCPTWRYWAARAARQHSWQCSAACHPSRSWAGSDQRWWTNCRAWGHWDFSHVNRGRHGEPLGSMWFTCISAIHYLVICRFET